MRILSALLLVAAASTVAQTPEQGGPPPPQPEMVQWPVIRPRNAKAEHEQNLKDTARMTQLLGDLRKDLSDERLVPVSALKKAEEIEKLIKRVRSRLR
jgi:hypothetical protein